MDLEKIAKFIREKRKKLNMTQEELAEKLYVTEKAISRWETGRGTPDISLLIPLARELNTTVSEILKGEEHKKIQNETEQLIIYNEIKKANRYNFQFKIIIGCYILSILFFLLYLRYEFNPNIELNYFLRLLIMGVSSTFIVIGNTFYKNNYVEKLEDKKKMTKFSKILIFIYYSILLFNMVLFARYRNVISYNFIPFKTILEIINNGNPYAIVINLFGNFFIFMPLEYFIIDLFKIKTFSFNFLISLGIISFIELIQLIFKIGVFDVDDILLCVSGMLFFYFLYRLKEKVQSAKKV